MSIPLGAVVVVAHGPSATTLGALERAASIAQGGRVLVVAGTEPGAAAVRAASRQGYTALEGHGSAGVASAILTCPAGPVLVIHDDAVLGTVGAEALLVAHLSSGLAAIPLGAAQGATADGTFEGRASLACTVGDREALAEIATLGAFAPGLVRRGTWFVTGRALIDHAGTCTHRLLDGRAPDGRPLLVAGMIVRDEAGFLPGCLASLASVVDRIEIVDTGSTDHTVAIAEAAGARVSSVMWRNDFAWARNQVLARCADAHYLLWIDADERLVCTDPGKLRRQLATYRTIYDALRIEITNLDGAEVTSTFLAKRIVRTSGIEFVGAIHEQPRPLDRDAPWLEAELRSCRIEHLGYATTVMTGRDKLARNLELAEADWHHRRDPESLLHYVRTLSSADGDPAKILSLLDDATTQLSARVAPASGDAAGTGSDRRLSRAIEAYLLGVRGQQLRALDRSADALAAARAALELVPADEVAQSLLADLLLAAGEPEQLLHEVAAARAAASVEPAFRDRVARAARNQSIVCAAAQTGAWGAAVTALEELPKGFDPWPVLLRAAAGQLDVVELLASAAAQRLDASFGRAVVALADDAGRAAAHRAWLAGGGDATLIPELHEAVTVAEAIADADQVFDAYLSGQREELAIDYARSVVVGAGDLCADIERILRQYGAGATGNGVGLPDADRAAQQCSLVLGCAAVAHERRGDLARARRDAETALSLWVGSPRAVAVIGRLFVAGDAATVVELVQAARVAGAYTAASGAQLVELGELMLTACASLGDFVGAVEEALQLVERDQLVPWAPLLRAAGDDLERQSVLVRLALFGEGDRFVDAMSKTVRPELTAELCAAFLLSGGTAPAAVSVGLAAAILKDRDDLIALLAEHANLLDAPIRANLAAKLRASGRAPVADHLTPTLAETSMGSSLKKSQL
jgi:tetratricopeptide (TPR) repeat protein